MRFLLPQSGVISNNLPVLIFDSGLGGLSVVRAFRQLQQQIPTAYVADQVHFPYGRLSYRSVSMFAEAMAIAFQEYGTRIMVLACNTASAHALYYLREAMPDYTFVGMEPGIKPAATMTKSGHIGVMATKGTFSGLPYRRVTERFASNIRVTECHCPDLISLTEAGMNTYEHLSSVMERELGWLLARDIDTLVLGCTHFSLIRSALEVFVGPDVKLFDPAQAVARQIIRCLEANGLMPVSDSVPKCRDLFCTTGDAYQFAFRAQRILADQPRIVWNAWWDNQ